MLFLHGHSRIMGVGAYVPPNVVTSKEVMEAFDSERRFGLPTDFLDSAFGIHERRVCDPGMQPSQMAAEAAQQAMARANVTPDEIDCIIYAGVKRDRVEPATAHNVQLLLGATNASTYDISNACLSLMSALEAMDGYIARGVQCGLICTGEQGWHYARHNIEQLLATEDREQFKRLVAGLTLGDAGGAMLLGPRLNPDHGILHIASHSDGRFHDLCVVQDDTQPVWTEMTPLIKNTAAMVHTIYREMMDERLHWVAPMIDHYVPHQVGEKAMKLHSKCSGVDLSRIPNIVSKSGNLIAASIPYAMNQLIEAKAIAPGQRIYLSGSGSGISVAQVGMVWDGRDERDGFTCV